MRLITVDRKVSIDFDMSYSLLRSIFDWRTPTTYMYAFTLEFLVTAYIVTVGSCLMLHSFGTIRLFMAFVDDIKTDMRALDAYKRNKISVAKFYDYLCEFIKFHTEIKQLSHCMSFSIPYLNETILYSSLSFFRLLTEFGNTYALFFTMNLLWTASTEAVLLVSLQMELVEYNHFKSLI